MGKYFSIKELTHSDTAKRKNIENVPDKNQIKNLENLIKVLDTIREEYGEPINVNSGFRSIALNRAVNGSKTSWHLTGMAADIRCRDNIKLWNLIVQMQKEGKIAFTELINEKANKYGVPTWIHIAVNPSNLKNQIKFIK